MEVLRFRFDGVVEGWKVARVRVWVPRIDEVGGVDVVVVLLGWKKEEGLDQRVCGGCGQLVC